MEEVLVKRANEFSIEEYSMLCNVGRHYPNFLKKTANTIHQRLRECNDSNALTEIVCAFKNAEIEESLNVEFLNSLEQIVLEASGDLNYHNALSLL